MNSSKSTIQSNTFIAKCDKLYLELNVRVINVNYEKGAELLEKCRLLSDYSQLVHIAKMNYQQAILKAGKEVSDALYLYDATERKLIEDQGRVDQLDKAVSYTKDLFQSGAATYLEILTAQQNLLTAQLAEVADNVQRIQAVITLYSSLGGGRE